MPLLCIRDRSWLTDTAWLAGLFLLFYFLWLGHYPLFTPDEGRYGEAAREMFTSGDYITPRVDGVAFLDKPILYYWLQAAAMHVFGVTEWAVRFFPALLGVFGCLVTYICGRQLFNRRTAILAAVILATAPLYFIGAHYANLDLEVAVWISCSLLFFLTGAQRKKTAFFYAAYFCAACAFLTKGLIGIAFPAMIAGAWIILLWRWELFKRIHLLRGILLFIALVVPWYVLVQQANPAFLHYFFVTQQVTRFLSAATFNNVFPFWFYAPIVFVGFLPWALFLIPALYKSACQTWRARSKQATELFLLLWIATIFVFFSIPHSKIVTYILPIFPAIALLIGQYINGIWSIKQASERRNKYIFSIVSACSALFLLIVVLNVQYFNHSTVKPLALQLSTVLQPQDEVVNYFRFYQDVPFYLGRRITLVADWQAPDVAYQDNWVRELWYGMAFQKTNDWLITENTFWQRWNSPKHLFVFVSEHFLNQFKQHTKQYYLLGQYNKIMLISNQPTLHKNI